MSYLLPHNCIKTVATTQNLCKIIQFRPQTWKEAAIQADAFARHPANFHFYFGAFAMAVGFNLVVGKYSDHPGAIKSSDMLHRNAFREYYKKEHGHFPH